MRSPEDLHAALAMMRQLQTNSFGVNSQAGETGIAVKLKRCQARTTDWCIDRCSLTCEAHTDPSN